MNTEALTERRAGNPTLQHVEHMDEKKNCENWRLQMDSTEYLRKLASRDDDEDMGFMCRWGAHDR
jgi:hypothetical protein